MSPQITITSSILFQFQCFFYKSERKKESLSVKDSSINGSLRMLFYYAVVHIVYHNYRDVKVSK